MSRGLLLRGTVGEPSVRALASQASAALVLVVLALGCALAVTSRYAMLPTIAAVVCLWIVLFKPNFPPLAVPLVLLGLIVGNSILFSSDGVQFVAKLAPLLFLAALLLIVWPGSAVAASTVSGAWLGWSLAFSCLANLSAVWSVSGGETLVHGPPLMVMILAVGVVVPLIVRTPNDALRLIRYLGLLAAGAVTLGVFFGKLQGTAAVEARYAGLFPNPNMVGYMAAPILPALIVSATQSGQRRWRAVSAVCSLVLALGVALSGSRAGIWSAVAGVAVSAIAMTGMPGARRALLRLGAAALACALVGSGILIALDRPLRPQGSGGLVTNLGTGNGRTLLWEDSLPLVYPRAILGHGYATSPDVLPALRGDFSGAKPAAHDSYLEVVLDLGIVGLALVVGLVAYTVLSALYVARIRSPWRIVGLAMLAGIIGGLVESLFEAGLTNPGGLLAFSFWLFSALACSMRKRLKLDARNQRRPNELIDLTESAV